MRIGLYVYYTKHIPIDKKIIMLVPIVCTMYFVPTWLPTMLYTN